MKIIQIILFLIITISCEESGCKLSVTLKSGEKINARYVQSFVSGVSNIKMCNGEDFQVNTSNIKSITSN